MVEELRKSCREGDVLFAPPAVGLFAYGVTRCRAVVSHPIAPDYAQRMQELSRFGAESPPERAAHLDADRVTHLVVPGDAGLVPAVWLGEGTAFRREAMTRGAGVLSLYVRRSLLQTAPRP